MWIPQIYGGADVLDELGAEEAGTPPDIKPFSTAIFHCGGAGARPGKDGLDVTAFPVAACARSRSRRPRRWRRSCSAAANSAKARAAPGDYRGGLGQVIELGGADGTPIAMLCNFERVGNPARGRDGGGEGAPGRVTLSPASRSARRAGRASPAATSSGSNCRAAAVSATRPSAIPSRWPLDVADGLISRETAERDYRVAVTAEGTVDFTATRELRATGTL